jgi:hypothetical protein
MAKIVLAALLVLISGIAQAADTCRVEAANKQLAGAALTSFMTKCENDARAKCETSATERRLAGAAKDSFTKKCVSEHIGEAQQ